ncbi:ScbR family autoregulator-binding transcription factor (plasmid) [Streptomyces sp. cg28]|uniref:ScbR family autoregulator-binding transcription factor n=1 Tax=unclassified Streptomyces TaxID=2593676 RepID=UPI000DB9F6D1|nr:MULTISPECIES: ScbR family autoregulator-binding transcription factor [unclassified Streptomyces]MYT69736.1 TetR family transcriptional regulator [Streptomyces sp. SID8367]RAJ69369.1 TetR family transcriptional regulator [Streptomyces sp. PsTaAH-137]
MAKQDRAVRTRRNILSAAATVFEERGYQAATITDILRTAGVTKGALYFHFQSKAELAYGVMDAQGRRMGSVPQRACRMQELADTVLLQTYRLQHDPLVRAGVRLAMDQQATELNRGAFFKDWSVGTTDLLEAAKTQGELLPHVVPAETAELLVGAYAGVHSMSQAVSSYADLDHRTSVLLRHFLPNVVLSSVLTTIDLSVDRGATVFAEVESKITDAYEDPQQDSA